MEKILNILQGVDRFVLALLKAFAILCFISLTILISANVFVRFVPVISLHWFDEIIELLYAYMIFYGAAALWITREHISVGDFYGAASLWITREHISVGDWMSGRLIKSPKAIRIYRLILECLVLMFALIFLFYSRRLTDMALDVTNVFAIPKKVLYSCMPISGLVMVVYSLRNIAMEIAGIKTGEALHP
ncbi:MAG: TRAP transporter small permease subunit [Deltaproteobacteria bacterium]|nr:TRAP transporter small permease subunit [Deltaproteobacteria bacterium]